MMQQHNGWCPGMTLAEVERETILLAYSHYKQNKTATAQSLGISIRTLDSRLEDYTKQNLEAEKRERERAAKDAEFLKRCRGESTQGTAPAKQADDATRADVQPPPVIPPKQPLSMPQREDVSGVLSRPAAASGSRRAR